MSGFSVNPDELREFASKLDGHHSSASRIAELIAMADVGDKSWGVVGIFVKDQYTQMLGDLKETMQAMQDGLRSGSGKFRDTAEGYAQQEEALKQLLNGIQVERG
ncbi:excreted virulence factor EspC (type VII ESX diderm) [Lentzea atacamensis]|uniref:Excreted virulence factor EspC (Type VII ESX diderm) n=1 Tax=Lentzea atacamensis TaxID=531938 RepID=A0ABX9DXF3_9PSEU|nr:type VII secretion target [Lentzea atacamensis]RAS60234.1 excreted virulence factor EspC (type VII ESX diderm) [Lentzea atacamensis]